MKRLAIYLHPYLGRIGLGFTIKFMAAGSDDPVDALHHH